MQLVAVRTAPALPFNPRSKTQVGASRLLCYADYLVLASWLSTFARYPRSVHSKADRQKGTLCLVSRGPPWLAGNNSCWGQWLSSQVMTVK